MYLGAPFTFAALQRWPKYRLFYAPIGLAVIALAMIISSFSTRVWQLIFTVSYVALSPSQQLAEQ